MDKNKIFMDIAVEVSKMSKCVSRQVGCILVKDSRILSTGYNGTPAGYVNCCDHWDNKYTSEHHEWSKKFEIHAEMNAILWASRKGVSIDGSTLFCTTEPCFECTKNMINAGIVEIFFRAEYPHINERELLNKFIADNNIKKTKI